MARLCPLCARPDLAAFDADVDAAVAAGETYYAIAKRLGVNRTSLTQHHQHTAERRALRALPPPRGCEEVKARARAMGRRIEDFLALSPNSDPFYAGQPWQEEHAAWFVGMYQRLGVREGAHLRAVHYLLLSKLGPAERRLPDGRPYENKDSCYAVLSTAASCARMLHLIPPHAFEDHRNPPPKLLLRQHRDEPAEPGWSIGESARESAGWVLPRVRATPYWTPDFPIPGPLVTGYDYDLADQPYHVEVWVEKSTMDDVLLPVCRRLGVNLVTSAGFQSISNAVDLLLRVAPLAESAAGQGKPVRIFYVSDFDPAGYVMPTAVARQLEFWGEEYAPGVDIKLTPLALTAEQIEELDLPRIPIKDTDKRGPGFEETHGAGAVELDALEALHPGELARLIEEAVAPYRDDTLDGALLTTAQEAQDDLDEEWAQALAPHRGSLDDLANEVRAVLDGYADTWAQLARVAGALQEEMAPLEARLEAIRQSVVDEVEGFDPDLPDRPEPDVEEPDESDWLYDSSRSYWAQLAAYKRRRRGATGGRTDAA